MRCALVLLFASGLLAQLPKIEDWTGRTILVFTPHPDDDTFGCGGTPARLAKNGNRIYIAIYTNDDKGSYDLEMTSQKPAAIRKAEEEEACRRGVPKENILWMGHHDGMLEYVNKKALPRPSYSRFSRPSVSRSSSPPPSLVMMPPSNRAATWREKWGANSKVDWLQSVIAKAAFSPAGTCCRKYVCATRSGFALHPA